MHYLIIIKKRASEKLECSENEPSPQYAKLAYVRGVEDLRPQGIKQSKRREILEDAIEENGVELDPKWPLSQVEEGHATPNVKVEPKRRQMRQAVYQGEFSIPEDLVKQHNKKHRRCKRGVRHRR